MLLFNFQSNHGGVSFVAIEVSQHILLPIAALQLFHARDRKRSYY